MNKPSAEITIQAPGGQKMESICEPRENIKFSQKFDVTFVALDDTKTKLVTGKDLLNNSSVQVKNMF